MTQQLTLLPQLLSIMASSQQQMVKAGQKAIQAHLPTRPPLIGQVQRRNTVTQQLVYPTGTE